MKRFPSPPVIVLFDVVLVAVYVLAFSQSPNMQIVLPDQGWVDDAVIVSHDADKKIQHWYDQQLQQWRSIRSFPKSHRRFSFMIGDIPCHSNALCREIPAPSGETKKIYIHGDLYDEISGMLSDSCLKFPQECANVTYHILPDGTVDRERLRHDHRMFRYILQQEI